jgi:hypothetical protein
MNIWRMRFDIDCVIASAADDARAFAAFRHETKKLAGQDRVQSGRVGKNKKKQLVFICIFLWQSFRIVASDIRGPLCASGGVI